MGKRQHGAESILDTTVVDPIEAADGHMDWCEKRMPEHCKRRTMKKNTQRFLI